MHNGIKKTSENAASRNKFLVCSSTTEITSLAAHQKFCPIIYTKKIVL